MLKTSDVGPRLTVKITEQEKALAKQAKVEFKALLKELKAAVNAVLDLRDSITSQHPSKEDLKNKYKGRLLRYKLKITKAFNVFALHLQKNLELLTKINDPDMSRLREILASEVNELKDGFDATLELIDEAEKDDFTKNLEHVAAQMEKRKVSIHDTIENQLFNHIDHDLLGRLRISQLRFNIQKRSRLLLLALKEG
jgi:predicted transglutaminase-like protease